MPPLNIAVQQTVYDTLTMEKRPGERFTALLGRLLDQRGGIEELAGAWGGDGSQSSVRLRAVRTGNQRGRR